MNKRFALTLLAGLLLAPAISPRAQAPAGRAQFVYVLRVLPPYHAAQAWTGREGAVITRHFERLAAAAAQGQVILAGKTTEPPDQTFGIVIFEADNATAARLFMEADPAVVAGIMSATLHPYAVALQRKP